MGSGSIPPEQAMEQGNVMKAMVQDKYGAPHDVSWH